MTGFSWSLYIMTDFLQSLYIMTEMTAVRIYNDWFRIRTITYVFFLIIKKRFKYFSYFTYRFLNPNLHSNCSNVLYLRNIQKQVKKAFCFKLLFWPFTVRINWSSDLKKIKFSTLSLEFHTVFSITRTILSHSRSAQFWQKAQFYIQ